MRAAVKSAYLANSLICWSCKRVASCRIAIFFFIFLIWPAFTIEPMAAPKEAKSGTNLFSLCVTFCVGSHSASSVSNLDLIFGLFQGHSGIKGGLTISLVSGGWTCGGRLTYIYVLNIVYGPQEFCFDSKIVIIHMLRNI